MPRCRRGVAGAEGAALAKSPSQPSLLPLAGGTGLWGSASHAVLQVSKDLPDEAIRQAVVNFLGQCPGISYSQVASTAFNRGRQQLAISV